MLSFERSIKDRVLSQLKESRFADAVKLYSAAVDAFPGSAYFKAGGGGDGDVVSEEPQAAAADDVDDARVNKLLQGLKVVFFCEYCLNFTTR